MFFQSKFRFTDTPLLHLSGSPSTRRNETNKACGRTRLVEMNQAGGILCATDSGASQQATDDLGLYPRLRLPPERWPLLEPVLSSPASPSPPSRGDRNRNRNRNRHPRLELGIDCQTRPRARSATSLASGDIRSVREGLRSNIPPWPYAGNGASAISAWSSPDGRQAQTSSLQSSSTQSSPGASYVRSTRHGHRPRLPRPIMPTVSSDFTPYNKGSKWRTADTIYHEIASLLKKGPGPGSAPKNGRSKADEYGKVYVLTREETKGYVKIGSTGGKVSDRIARISPKGYYGQLIHRPDERDPPFKHFAFAEKIIQLELHNVRHESRFNATPQDNCVPGSPHRENGRTEWYKMDPQQAKDVVVRWRDWLHLCEPYDRHGKLKGYWRHVISSAEKYESAKHGDIGNRWGALLKPPSRYQLGRYYLGCFLQFLLESLVYTLGMMCSLCERFYHLCYG